ncbi:VanZ family protein [Salinibacterium hongtaonis]|uniref:VanZ family protein n=1 Tax=Homoserinimonas hongtaonis TaxID=2079791 RepID=UPI001E2D26EB|nr:VanZ family protein [Salinibacterium hongtaonis]
MLRRHPLLSLATVAYLAIVGWLTLGPQPLDGRARSLLWNVLERLQAYESLQWITYDRIEFAANVLMFIPIGLLFVLLFGRRQWWFAILVSVLVTVGIEFAQLFLNDRVTDIRDLISNASGAVVGVVLALLLTWPKEIAQRRSSRSQKGADARVSGLV